MTVRVHECGTRGDVYVVFNVNAFIYDKGYAMPYVDPVSNRQSRLIKDASAKDIHLAEKINVVAHSDFRVTYDKGHLLDAEPLPDGFAPSAEKWLAIEIALRPS
jgi:hypothetical protein